MALLMSRSVRTEQPAPMTLIRALIHPGSFFRSHQTRGSVVQRKIQELNREEPVFEHEHEFKTSATESRWFQWTIRGVFSEDDKLIEVQWVGRDVTDRIRLLERLNKIDKIESLGVFAGGIAHDFNNYLTSIMGTLTLMRRNITSPTRDTIGWRKQNIRS